MAVIVNTALLVGCSLYSQSNSGNHNSFARFFFCFFESAYRICFSIRAVRVGWQHAILTHALHSLIVSLGNLIQWVPQSACMLWRVAQRTHSLISFSARLQFFSPHHSRPLRRTSLRTFIWFCLPLSGYLLVFFSLAVFSFFAFRSVPLYSVVFNSRSLPMPFSHFPFGSRCLVYFDFQWMRFGFPNNAGHPLGHRFGSTPISHLYDFV